MKFPGVYKMIIEGKAGIFIESFSVGSDTNVNFHILLDTYHRPTSGRTNHLNVSALGRCVLSVGSGIPCTFSR